MLNLNIFSWIEVQVGMTEEPSNREISNSTEKELI